MRRCEDEKMRYRPPLLEEPCAQTRSGKNSYINRVRKEKGKETTNREDERAPEIEKNREEEKREERTRGIRTKTNRINSRVHAVTKRLYQGLPRKHRANAVKKNNYINRKEKRKGTNQQNREDKRE